MGASFKLRNPKNKNFEDAASLVYPNPELTGEEERLASIDIDGEVFEVKSGSDVIPNPEITEEDESLNSLQIGDAKFKIPGGTGDLPNNLVYSDLQKQKTLDAFTIVKSPFALAIRESNGDYGYITTEGKFVPFPRYYLLKGTAASSCVDNANQRIVLVGMDIDLMNYESGIFTFRRSFKCTITVVFAEIGGSSSTTANLQIYHNDTLIETVNYTRGMGKLEKVYTIDAQAGDTFRIYKGSSGWGSIYTIDFDD